MPSTNANLIVHNKTIILTKQVKTNVNVIPFKHSKHSRNKGKSRKQMEDETFKIKVAVQKKSTKLSKSN